MHVKGILLTLGAVILVHCSAKVIQEAKSENNVCNGVASYGYPIAESCWMYNKCKDGSVAATRGWCFPLIRRFSPTDLKCEWFWQVKNCGATPAPPPTPPPSSKPSWPCEHFGWCN